MVRSFSLWVPTPEGIPRAHEFEAILSEALRGQPLRWAITAVDARRLRVEGAFRLEGAPPERGELD